MLVDVLIIPALAACVFIAAMAGAFLIWRLGAKAQIPPATNTRIRLRQGAAVYESYFIESPQRRLWRISAPRAVSHVAPLRPADRFIAEYTTANGVALFETTVIARCQDGPSLLITGPARLVVRDRRETPRRSVTHVAEVNGITAVVENICEGGAKLLLPVPIPPGGDIRLLLASNTEIDAVVLNCKPEPSDAGCYSVRVRFVRPYTQL